MGNIRKPGQFCWIEVMTANVSASKKFYAELNRMPRDMRLDEKVVLTTFCKCFNLMDRQKADTIDEAAFKNFAEMWVRSMRNVPVYGVDIAMSDAGSGGGADGPGPAGGPGAPGGKAGR